MVFYDDIRSLHDEIDVVAVDTSLNSSNATSLSNILSYDYMTTSDLNDQVRKKERTPLHEGHIKGIGSSVGMQPYKGGVGNNFRGH